MTYVALSEDILDFGMTEEGDICNKVREDKVTKSILLSYHHLGYVYYTNVCSKQDEHMRLLRVKLQVIK